MLEAREDEMEDASVNLSWFGVPCHCRCRHCLLNSGDRLSTVPYENAKHVVERFLRWRDRQEVKGFTVSFAVGYSSDFPHLMEYVKFCARLDMGGGLQVGGMRRRSEEELRQFLPRLKSAGVSKVGLSFYGMGKSHDDFARRKGDFDFLLNIAQAVTDCDMERFETIFVRRGFIGELPALLHELESIPGSCSRSLTLFDYRGRGKFLEEVRPTLADIEALPDSVFRFLNRDRYKTEREWVRNIAMGTIPEKKHRHYLIPIWKENIQELETWDLRDILLRLRRMDVKVTELLPSLAELADIFAQPDSNRLYALRDLEWKWRDMYFDKHPEIEVSGRFDDLSECVLNK